MISPLVVIQAFAPLLGTDKKRQGPTGLIVNISSSGAKVAIPLIGAYSSSKAGLEGMSDALRQELMLFGIDVVIIEPGTVNTAMYDKGEKEDLSEFKQTEYWEAVQNFQKFIGYPDVVRSTKLYAGGIRHEPGFVPGSHAHRRGRAG